MSYLVRVQEGVDHIEEHLDDDLSLAAVAAHAGLSQWHFQRIFRGLTGETLKAYIRSRRMARALHRLLSTDLRVLDIALAARFESQEAFSRAFKRSFSMTPTQYRELGRKNLFPRKVQFDREYLKHIHRNISQAPTVIRRPRMHLVGMRTHFYGAESEKNNLASKVPPLWAEFTPRVHEIRDPIQGTGYGVIRTTSDDSDLLEYVAAVEVTAAGNLPPGMVELELGAETYAVFEHRGDPDQLDLTVNYIYSTWLTQSVMWHTQRPDLEIYGPQYVQGSVESSMQYAIPIGDEAPRFGERH
ncbi:MAG: AraC family transcriptional regulator [Nannocystaceae bacterium]|nr:AraC family transcriptional regulator [Nannocystaceae bacterium]